MRILLFILPLSTVFFTFSNAIYTATAESQTLTVQQTLQKGNVGKPAPNPTPKPTPKPIGPRKSNDE